MLARLLETPLIDVLLILLLLRIFFPSLFGVKSKKTVAEKKQTNISYSSSREQQKHKREEGEYIDYEDLK